MFYYNPGWSIRMSARRGCSVLCSFVLMGGLLIPLAGCGASLSSEEVINPSGVSGKRSLAAMEHERIASAEKYFNEGKYGSAEQAYRLAIEANPRNARAWLGIAATYDNLKRFPNANRAYMIAIKIQGYTPEILNNLGYHYILRGDFPKARKALTAAQKKQPDNKFVQNNINLLEKYEEQNNKSVPKGQSY